MTQEQWAVYHIFREEMNYPDVRILTEHGEMGVHVLAHNDAKTHYVEVTVTPEELYYMSDPKHGVSRVAKQFHKHWEANSRM